MRRAAPRPVAVTVEALTARLAPSTPLAEIQGVWSRAVGPAIAAEATPVSERAGTVTLACRSGVWAQELDLLSADLVARLNGALGRPLVRGLRCTATGSG